MIFRLFYQAVCFTVIIVLVNNSTLKSTKGLVVGIGQSLGAASRAAGQTLIGKLFDVGKDLDFLALPVLAAALFAFILLVQVSLLSPSLRSPKPEPDHIMKVCIHRSPITLFAPTSNPS